MALKKVYLWLACALPVAAEPFADFDAAARRWTLGNEQVSIVFQLTNEGQFRFVRLSDHGAGADWAAPADVAVAPFSIELEGFSVDGSGPYRLISQGASEIDRGGLRQSIVIEHLNVPVRVRFEAEVYQDQPVVRYRSWLENRGSRRFWVSEARMVNWQFQDGGRSFRSFRVNQWVRAGKGGNFETIDALVEPDAAPLEVYSGAHGQHCAWLVTRDTANRGLLLGWEFDGRARIQLRHRKASGFLEIAGGPEDLSHPVAPGEQFLTPGAFLGVFRGDWDEASFRTHRFVEAVLARPMPQDSNFPYVMWDSWGYDQEINGEVLKRTARVAARMGIEVLVLDLGWARAVGDWRADPAKFPSGLKDLSDYVHSLGMKFGLHLAFVQASSSAPMLRAHPEWFASDPADYYGARSLCLSHRPVRDWITNEILRVIREYGVDWILQDGENMVKRCARENHTHDPDDSNYSNAVDGLDAVLDAVQRAEPGVLWENVEDGGNMMTFSMVQRYDTSIAADDSGPLTTRQATHGVTFPFPTRYADRYMPENELNGYITRSYMFGGPWIFMNKIAGWSEEQIEYAASQIALYKQLRRRIRDGRVYHLSARPEESRTDAIQSMDPVTGSALVFVYREVSTAAQRVVRPRGLVAERLYVVSFEESPERLLVSGSSLMRDGIRVPLPESRSAEIVYIEPIHDPL